MIEADRQLAKVDINFVLIMIIFYLCYNLSDKYIIFWYFLILHTFNKYITASTVAPHFLNACIFLFKRLLYVYLECHHYKLVPPGYFQ